MTKQRIFENPIIGDRVTYLETSEETNGAYGLAELELVPGGGNPLHYHNSFYETFSAVKGALTVQVDKEIMTLLPGDSFTVPPKTNHCFSNRSGEPIIFTVQVQPGHTGFENAIKIAYGLARDGETNNKGLPKKISHTAILLTMSDGNVPGILSFVMPVLRLIAKRARKKGIEQQLIDRYCN